MTDVKILQAQFDSFKTIAKKEFAHLHETNRTIIATIDVIKENHLAHMSEKISKLENKVGNVGTEIAWLKKVQWAMVTGLAGNLIGVIYLVINSSF